MKIVNFLLAVIAIVIAVAAFGMSMRGGFSRFADMQIWKITEDRDAMVLNSVGHPREITVCNMKFRRRGEGYDVVVVTKNGDAYDEHVLVNRACITTRGETVTVAKPEGERFETYGIYKLGGKQHMRYMRHGGYGKMHKKRQHGLEQDDTSTVETVEEVMEDAREGDVSMPASSADTE